MADPKKHREVKLSFAEDTATVKPIEANEQTDVKAEEQEPASEKRQPSVESKQN